MTTQLYKLTEQYNRLLLDKVDIETGELFDAETEFKAKLAEIKDKIEDKAENLGKLYLMLNADVKTLSDEINRLESKKKSAKNKAEWIREYLLDQLTIAKIEQVERPTVKVKISTNNPSVDITDINEIPAEYLKEPPPPEASKTLILQHYKDTKQAVPGVEIVTDKKRVDIK